MSSVSKIVLPKVFGLLVLVSISACSEELLAKSVYVAINGSDANSGTSDSPYRTIKYGISKLVAGDTLYVAAGTYSEVLSTSGGLSIASGTSYSNAVTIQGAGSGTIIKPPVGGSTGILLAGPYHHIVWNDFVLDGSNIGRQISGFGLSNGAHHIRIQRVEVKNFPGSGILTGTNNGTDVHDNEYLDLIVHDNGSISPLDHGIYLSSEQNATIRGGQFYNHRHGWGIQWFSTSSYSGSGTYSGLTISGVTAHDNAGGGIVIGGVDNVLAYNNVLYSNGSLQEEGGISVAFSDLNQNAVRLYNNTVYNNVGYALRLSHTTNGSAKNNILWGNTHDSVLGSNDLPIVSSDPKGNTEDHNTTANPLFMDAAGADFRLRATSPARAAGADLSTIFNSDLVGATRPPIGAFDTGAYSYQSATTTTPAISFSPSQATPGQTITVNVDGGAITALDWVAIYSAIGDPDIRCNVSCREWKYLNNTKTPPSAGVRPASLTFTAPSNPGNYEFRFFANDGYTRLAVSSNLTISNGATNRAPLVNAGPDQTITLPSTAALSATASDDGLPNGKLTYQWTALSGAAVVFTTPSSPNTQARFTAAGVYSLTLTVSDGLLLSSDNIIVTVKPDPLASLKNTPPIVNAGADQAIALPAGAVLSASANDDGLPNGALTYQWTVVNGAGVVFSAPSSRNTQASFSAAGTYTLRVTVSDGLLSSSDDINVVATALPTTAASALTLVISRDGEVLEGSKTPIFVQSADSRVQLVELYVDGQLAAALRGIALRYRWDTRGAVGVHTVQAVAYDQGSQIVGSVTSTITVR